MGVAREMVPSVEVVLASPVVLAFLAFMYRVDKNSRKAVRLLEGHDAVEDDGVLSRLSNVEDIAEQNRRVLRDEDLLEAEPDGGHGGDQP